jgi:hypothetical protein
MTIVSNFTLIQGDENQYIGDGATLWEKTFRTDGRLDNEPAIVMLMVQGLLDAGLDVDVEINSEVVGQIFRYTGAEEGHWYTNIIRVAGAKLVDGENTIRLQAVPIAGGGGTGNYYDNFAVRDVVCFFHLNV